MTKQFFVIFVMLFALLTFASCTHNAETVYSEATQDELYAPQEEPPIIVGSGRPQLFFCSLEEFLDAHAAAKERRPFSSRFFSYARFAELAAYLNFAQRDEIHLLANIPESYRITEIITHDNFMLIVYMPTPPEGVDPVEWTSRMFDRYRIVFSVFNWSRESLDEVGRDSPTEAFDFTEEDLISEKHFFCERSNDLFWVEGYTLFILDFPRPAHQHHDPIEPPVIDSFDDLNAFWFANAEAEAAREAAILPMSDFDIAEILHLAQTVAVNLHDEASLAALSAGDFEMLAEISQ